MIFFSWLALNIVAFLYARTVQVRVYLQTGCWVRVRIRVRYSGRVEIRPSSDNGVVAVRDALERLANLHHFNR